MPTRLVGAGQQGCCTVHMAAASLLVLNAQVSLQRPPLLPPRQPLPLRLPSSLPPPLLPAPHPTGNLARFLNHSCNPNLMQQPVLIPGDSALRYRMCFFAFGLVQPPGGLQVACMVACTAAVG